jgi:hypothetical protein
MKDSSQLLQLFTPLFCVVEKSIDLGIGSACGHGKLLGLFPLALRGLFS